MKNALTKVVAASAAAAVITAGLAGSAFATTSTTTDGLAALKARASTAVSERLDALELAISDVNANRWITATDKTALLTTLNADHSALSQLGPQIQADPTLAQASKDYRTIFTGYRVFALALPQVRIAAAADDLADGVAPRLSDAEQRLESLLSGPDSAKNSQSVQAAMQDLAKEIPAITSDVSGLSATVIGYTPAQWNANHQLLNPAHQSLVTARSAARTARQDIATVLAALK